MGVGVGAGVPAEAYEPVANGGAEKTEGRPDGVGCIDAPISLARRR